MYTWLVSLMIVMALFVSYILKLVIKIWLKWHVYPTIQKPDISDNYVDRILVAQLSTTVIEFPWKNQGQLREVFVLEARSGKRRVVKGPHNRAILLLNRWIQMSFMGVTSSVGVNGWFCGRLQWAFLTWWMGSPDRALPSREVNLMLGMASFMVVSLVS